MWAHTPNAGRTPRHSGRKFTDASSSAGKTPSRDDVLVVVDVVDELVERGEALHQPGLDRPPLLGVDDAGDDVEGPGPVDAAPVGVHGERDAHREDVEVGPDLPFLELGQPELPELGHEERGRGAGGAVGRHQFVPRRGRCNHGAPVSVVVLTLAG